MTRIKTDSEKGKNYGRFQCKKNPLMMLKRQKDKYPTQWQRLGQTNNDKVFNTTFIAFLVIYLSSFTSSFTIQAGVVFLDNW